MLTKYKVADFDSTLEVREVYLASDVDKVVEELQATIRDHEESERTAWDAAHKAEANLARVTAELETLKREVDDSHYRGCEH